MKRILPGFLTAAVLTLAVLGNAYLTSPAVAQPPDENAQLKEAVKKLAAELAEAKAAAAKQAQPMPAGAGGKAVPAPVPGQPPGPGWRPAKAAAAQPGRGYIPLTPAQRAKFVAEDLKKHGNRIAMQAQTQVFPPAFNATTVVPLDVGDQAQCGSCYLCSTAKTATAAGRKAGYGGKGFTLSWQYGMDRPRDFGGCDGGNGTEVIDYMCKQGWIAETWVDATGTVHNDYPPYEADTGRDRTKPGAKVWMQGGQATWGFVNRNGTPSTDEIKASIFNYGRINIAIDAGGQFSNGTGTITSLGRQIDHEINVSGWDDAKDGGSWLLENQWDTSWGNGGYRWCTYAAAKNIVDWFWVSFASLPPPDPQTVGVPSVVGSNFAAAKASCAAVGLSCDLASGDPAMPVNSQTPAAGSQVASGSTVTVTTGVTPPNPPDPSGDIVVRIPAGSAAGPYIAISEADAATIKKNQDEINAILSGAGGGNAPTPVVALPPGFTADDRLPAKLAEVLRSKGHPLLARRLERESESHPLVAKRMYERMAKDPAGRKLLSEYKSGQSLPPGWLMQWADWILKNLPAILAILLPLFGL